MELNFTVSGKDYTEGKQTEWREMFEHMTWHEFKEGEKVAMMPGMAINQIIEEMQPRKALRWSISHDAAPYGLVGVEFKYKDAVVKSYWLDEGAHVVCLASSPEYVDSER